MLHLVVSIALYFLGGNLIMRCSQAGFTLIELLVTIVIVAILSAMAAPSYRSVITDMRMGSEINSLLGDLNFARSEALKRGQNVSVCASPSPSSATTVCTSTTDWSSGWVVLAPLSTAPLLRVSAGVTHGDTLISSLSSNPVITPLGYAFYGAPTAIVKLHDSNHSVALYRCIVFSSGSWILQAKGAVICQ